jgi:hypothetical protein
MQFTKRELVQGEGGNLFLKLKDGESVTGVFRGEIYEFYSRWDGNRSKVTSVDDPEGKSRFRLNFVTKEENKLVAKIWEFGVGIYNQLADLNEDYSLEETKVKITRRGTGTDTTYNILPTKDKLDEKALNAIAEVGLQVLEHKQEVPF